MSRPPWREAVGTPTPIKAEPLDTDGSTSSHSSFSPVSPMALSPSAARAAALVSPHVIELLAPLYAGVPFPDNHDVAVYAVALQRTRDDWLHIVFPELSRPGKMVAVDVACVNHTDAGGCRCDFVRLLRSVLVLTERNLLRVTIKYVVTATADSDARLATLQLFVALHEKASASSLALGHALQDFDLVLSHLQAGLMAVRATRDGTRIADTVEKAKRTKCHVVGCDLHQWDDPDGASVPRFTLDEVFHRLTTHVEVDQMPIRDDATYELRMNQRDRDLRLTDLPIPALHSFVRMLGARDLAAVSAVCTMFQHLAYEVVPGLELLLYSHQRKGLRWLLYREGSSRRDLMSMPHPYAFPTVPAVSPLANPQDEDPDPKAIDLIDNRLVPQASIPRAMDFRGGLFCDEPGLGKTITMLALILRTKGQRTDPRTLKTEDPSSSSTAASRSLRSSSGSRGRELDPLALTPSATSLIVVPNPLLDHWKFQIVSHVTRGVLKVFVDDLECKQTLPLPQELATYDLVITSFGRLTDEWKYRRPTSALEQRRPDRYGYEDTPDRFIDGFVNRGTSPLLRVHWVRIIVDEGHKLGGTNQAYHMRMARLLHADKRWVMTGTPTPNTLQSADLRHMHGLLVFLRDRPYGEADGKAWLKAIAKPFEQHDRVGYVRLLHLLNRIMMRHTKDSVRTLIPSPVRHVVLIHPTPREYAMYNGVAAAVRANLVITNKDPHTPGKLHPDSLLNPIHRRWAKQVTGNLRLATCGGGQIKATLTRESFAETINMLNMHGVDQERIAQTIQFIRQAESIDVLSLCTLCGRHLQLLMLIPCGHMACADCVESRVERLGPSCGICNASYDWEIFQMLQPGFEFGNVEENWDYDDTPTPGAGDQAGNGRNGGRGVGTARRRDRHDGSTIPVRQQHGNRQRTVPIDLSRFVTVNASKAFYVASRITELKREYARGDTSSHVGRQQSRQPKVVKAIIFSQFKEHIWRVKVALAQQGIKCADFITGVSPAMRMEGLLKFRTDPQSNVLVLTDVGSHGLDLSFVTHIFLMDEIWDKSLEKQVVARAHRMGARHAVVVEQLLMRASVEEIMHDMNKRDNHNDDEKDEEEEEEEDDDDERRPSHHHTPGSRAMRGFFAGEHKLKHKRHKHRVPPHAKASANDKSSMQHRQLQHLLQSLRLIEEHAVAVFGVVQFEVRDTHGAVVRAASLRLPNPGKPPATSDTTAGQASPPLPRATSQGSVPRPLPAATVTPSAPVPPAQPVAKPKPKKPAMQVRIKTETSPRATAVKRPVKKTHGPHEPALGMVIDLALSDSSSSGGETVHSRDKRTSANQTYSGTFYTASGEGEEAAKGGRRVDDSETEDDEWVPVKREQATKRSPVKVKAEPRPNGKGKRKRVVGRWEDEEEEEEADYRPTKQRRGGRVMFHDDEDDEDE